MQKCRKSHHFGVASSPRSPKVPTACWQSRPSSCNSSPTNQSSFGISSSPRSLGLRFHPTGKLYNVGELQSSRSPHLPKWQETRKQELQVKLTWNLSPKGVQPSQRATYPCNTNHGTRPDALKNKETLVTPPPSPLARNPKVRP